MGSGNRAGNQLMNRTNDAIGEMRGNMSGIISPWEQAADSWNPSRNLSDYDTGTQSALQNMQSGISGGNDYSLNAANRMQNIAGNMGTQASTQQYLNPMMDQMLSKAMQQVQGSAGAALQSSNTQNAITDRVAGMAGDMWNTAWQQGMDVGNAQLGVGQQQLGLGQNMANTALQQGQTTHDIYSQQLQNRMAPAEAATQMAADMEAAALNAKLGAAGDAAAARSTDWFS